MLNNKIYEISNGVTMGSPLGPALANSFMCSFENKYLKKCPHGLKSVFYRCYVNNIFVLFSSLNHAKKFKKYLPSKFPKINFLLKKENDGSYFFRHQYLSR